MDRPTWTFPHRLMLVVAVLVLAALLWRLAEVAVLAFGGVVLAIALRGLAARLERYLRVPARVSVVVAALTVLAGVAAVSWLVGDALAEQLTRLRETLPEALRAATAWLGRHTLGRQLLDVLTSAWNTGMTGARLAAAASLTLGALGSALLMAIVGVYFAADPHTYREGLIRLAPPSFRPRLDAALRASGEGLSRWLLGQGLSMLFLGLSTAIGLRLLGVPQALALGLITSVLAFVPFFGAITAGVLSVLFSFVEGPQKALYVALLFLAIQQVEEYVLLPFVQRWAVSLPPVLTLFATFIFGLLFGPLGVVFATPMMVVAMVLVRKLYIEDTLEAMPRG